MKKASSLKVFAENLDRLMRLRGIKNPWLAEQIGVSRQAVHQWRRGLSYPSQKYIDVLCKILNCTEKSLNEEKGHAYAMNLNNYLIARNLTPVSLATILNVPFEVVRKWLNAEETPSSEMFRALAKVLECGYYDIVRKPKVLSLSMWAKRERISVTRAEDLFKLRIISGAITTPFGMIVPWNIKVPKNSKFLVMMAKRRPLWGEAGKENFAQNLKTIMDANKISNYFLAERLDINPTTVSHWRNGLRTPDENSLENIAAILGCTVIDLVAPEDISEAA